MLWDALLHHSESTHVAQQRTRDTLQACLVAWGLVPAARRHREQLSSVLLATERVHWVLRVRCLVGLGDDADRVLVRVKALASGDIEWVVYWPSQTLELSHQQMHNVLQCLSQERKGGGGGEWARRMAE